jgi:hypothetical protein
VLRLCRDCAKTVLRLCLECVIFPKSEDCVENYFETVPRLCRESDFKSPIFLFTMFSSLVKQKFTKKFDVCVNTSLKFVKTLKHGNEILLGVEQWLKFTCFLSLFLADV